MARVDEELKVQVLETLAAVNLQRAREGISSVHTTAADVARALGMPDVETVKRALDALVRDGRVWAWTGQASMGRQYRGGRLLKRVKFYVVSTENPIDSGWVVVGYGVHARPGRERPYGLALGVFDTEAQAVKHAEWCSRRATQVGAFGAHGEGVWLAQFIALPWDEARRSFTLHA